MLLILETITWKPHLETGVEVALQRHASGERVVYCNLRDGLPACEDESRLHALIDLPATRIRRASELLGEQGIEWLSPGYARAELARADEESARLIEACRDNTDLKRIQHDGFQDLGWGVLSSAVSFTRNSLVDVHSHRALLQRYCAASILVFEKACELIDRYRPDQVLLFNGRFATTRAVMRAAEAKGVPWLIHERGADKDRFWLTDCLPHDMRAIQEKMLLQWRPEHAEAGHSFFRGRRERVERAWHSFTKAQQYGRLPAEVEAGGDWVAFFTTSEDEMMSIGDRNRNTTFPTQLEAIEAVAAAVKDMPGTRLCVRVHPHTSLKSREDREKWARLQLPGVLVIQPDDPTDTYALVERAKVVCTYGSTVGVEATYWGTPSLLFARSHYDQLGVCEVATGGAQIAAFLRDPKTYPAERCLPYGAFWALLGEPYRFYKADTLHRGSICGIYLDDSRSVRTAKRLLGPASRLFGWG
jgi:hypothetical protein